jgi:hypothetical protein
MWVLNVEHDLCLASGERNFIPPRAVVEFAQRCRWIGRYMPVPQGAGQIVPWGWNMQLKERLLREGVPAAELPSDAELEFIKENSRRELSVELLEHLKGGYDGSWGDDGKSSKNGSWGDRESGGRIVSSRYRIVAHSLREIEEFLEKMGRVVLKAPLSGSGKGVRFVTGELMETDRGWCRRTLESQGAVIVEERLDVVQEFAMLFEVGEVSAGVEGTCIGGIKFMGYSMFYASNGAYKGNLLASNGYIEEKLAKDVGKNILEGIRENVSGFLQGKLGGRYTGFVGVDMFLYRGGEGRVMINPAVEINLRMTMGLIARNIFDHHREELQLGDGTHCFEPERGIIAK